MPEIDITVALPKGIEQRLDQYVSNKEILTRGQIKARNLKAFKGDKALKLSAKVKDGLLIHLQWEEEAMKDLTAEPMDLDILFEDEDVVVVNKPAGMVVHPALGNWTGTLVQGLLHHNREFRSDLSMEEGRPGIVHRLDKDTTGIIITARNTKALEALSQQFRERETEKTYLALVKGCPRPPVGEVEGYMTRDPKNRKKFMLHPTKGKWSLSHYSVVKRWRDFSLVEVKIETGRTHQIRVHMQSLGCPIVGDSIYSRRDSLLGDINLMLHSWKLQIKLPSDQEPRLFETEPPQIMKDFMKRLDDEFSL